MSSASCGQLPPDLACLTVSQLKALCKDAKITGYSKLGKAALVQRLQEKLPVLMGRDTDSAGSIGKGDCGHRNQHTRQEYTGAGADDHSAKAGDLVDTLRNGALTQSSSQSLPTSKDADEPSSTIHASLVTQVEGISNNVASSDDLQRATDYSVPMNQTLRSVESSLFLAPQAVECSSMARRSPVGTRPPTSCKKRPASSSQNVSKGRSKKLRIQAPNTTGQEEPTGDNDTTSGSGNTSAVGVEISREQSFDRRCNNASGKGSLAHPLVTQRCANIADPKVQLSPPDRGHPTQRYDKSTLTKSTASTSGSTVLPYLSTARSEKLDASRTLPSSKRFQKLVPQPRPLTDKTIQAVALDSVTELRPPVLRYLDFECVKPVSLSRITLPISLGDRKKVGAWAIILSGLDDAERRACARVSRLFRYAVYLSATIILEREYLGRRYAALKHMYPTAMTNYWPYLRQRRAEVAERKVAYQKSILARWFHGYAHVSEGIWCSPDHPMQIAIALRFVMTRLWFKFSLQSSLHGLGNNYSVVDAQEVVKDELWTVTVALPHFAIPLNPALSTRGGEKYTFYVLEKTCEVIGRAKVCASSSLSLISTISLHVTTPTKQADALDHSHPLSLRADWSDYIQTRLLPSGFHDAAPPSLLSHLRWPNVEDYANGISKVWLKRIEKEGAEGLYKKVVAERYVVASVVGNSVSGKWMSATDMAQDFAGKPSIVPLNKDKVKVNLYLPEHHFVESVHFKASSKKPLHDALAVVQTPNREYYILRDNGMEVGCEEDGVAEVWQRILQCDEKGAAH